MNENFGIKELYEACFKTTDILKVGSSVYDEGEPILYFEKIATARIGQPVETAIARGGKGSYPQIFWDIDGEQVFELEHGLLSKESFGLLANAKTINTLAPVYIPKNEYLLTNSNGEITLSQTPYGKKPIFVYKVGSTRERIKDFTLEDKKITTNLENNENIFVSYYYIEINGQTSYELGYNKLNAFLRLEGKMRYKDEISGEEKTCIVIIPRLKIASNLLLNVGEKASPVVSKFNIIMFPTKRGTRSVGMEFYFLNSDDDYDI